MIKKTIVMFMALAAMIGLKANGGVPPAQVGIINVGGTAYSGGSINYYFDMNALVGGQLVVKASIKANGWKVKLPVLMAAPGAGVSTIAGPFTGVPAGFTGDAMMTVQVKYAGKSVAKRSFLVTIATPPPVASSFSFSKLDVGFSTLVALDGTQVPTTYMTNGPITYAWTKTSGPSATLSSASAAAPTFTTGALTDFVDLTPSFGVMGAVGIDSEQVAESTYAFRVLVSDGSITRTGTYTVACASMSPAHPNIPLGVNAYVKNTTSSTNWVLVSKPVGSTTTLVNGNLQTPYIKPDVEGTYIIQDLTTSNTVTLTTATWTGYQFCNICHGPGNNVNQKDIVTAWSQTGHASFFQRGIDGAVSAYYGEGCISCHTVGYNKATAANNGGFDDVAALLGWSFPTTKVAGNFAALPVALQAKGNIQCESCHGPGSLHPGAPSATLEVAVCAQCHQDGHYHTRVAQWEVGPHSEGYKEVSGDDGGLGNNSGCNRCHSPEAFTDMAKRVDTLIAAGTNAATAQIIVNASSNLTPGIGELTCQTCHDPHDKFDNDDRHQLRIYDTVVIGDYANPGYVTLTNQGNAATCEYCHSSRRLPLQLSSGKPRYQSTRSGVISGPHESPIAEVFNGYGLIDYGTTLGNSFHTVGVPNKCITCHMYANPAIGQPGHDKVGDHTFSMTYMDGTNEVDNIAACKQCHTEELTSFDFVAYNEPGDFDGDGIVSGVQTEVKGLLNRLKDLLTTTGLTVDDTTKAGSISSTGLSTNAAIKEAQLKASWNWIMIHRDGSLGVHNTQYTVRGLQTSYTDLSTNWYANASKTFKGVFTNAYLR